MANLVNYQASMLEINKGKQVTVNLISGQTQLYLHDIDHDCNGFTVYICHSAKRPRKPYERTELSYMHNLHANLDKGYYFVDPIRIIL